MDGNDSSLVYRGFWWLPSDEENQVSGELIIYPDGSSELTIVGRLIDFRSASDNVISESIIVNGLVDGGRQVTLLAFHRKTRDSMSGIVSQVLYCPSTFVGAEFKEKNEIKFKQITLNFPNLDLWASELGEYKYGEFNSEKIINFEYRLPEPLLVYSDSHTTIRIVARAKREVSRYPVNRFSFEEEVLLEVESHERRELDPLLKFAWQFRDFLTLVTSNPSYVRKIYGKAKANWNPYEKEWYFPKVEIYLHLPNLISKNRLSVQQNNFLFSVKKLKKESHLLTKWFDGYSYIEPSLDLYFNIFYINNLKKEQKFLFLIQAIESLHRRLYPDKQDLPDVEHKKRIETILDSIDEQHRGWLEKKLPYSNEWSLRQRLKHFVDMYGEILTGYIKKKNFVNKAVGLRNYLTHYNENAEGQVSQVEEVVDLYEKIKTILEIAFLERSGFDLTEIKKMLVKRIQRRQSLSVAVHQAKRK